MGIIAKSKSSSSTPNNNKTSFFLVFFPEDSTTTTGPPQYPPPPLKPPSSPIKTTTTTTRPDNYYLMTKSNSNNRIITKTQSTISMCMLSLLLTLLLFTLSTFEPTTTSSSASGRRLARRFLSQNHPKKTLNFFTSTKKQGPIVENSVKFEFFALQGMGRLYLRGTRAVSDLVVCHAMEDLKEQDLMLFLRVLFRSGLTSKADVVFLFSSSSAAAKLGALVREESDSFLKLIEYYRDRSGSNSTSCDSGGLVPIFDVTRFLKVEKKGIREPLWGRRVRVNSGDGASHNVSESGTDSVVTRLSYGSVVGFEVGELDPENSLSGFLDHVPMSLRRWACYPMLLGRVKKNFKHVMLIDPKDLIVIREPLHSVRSHTTLESVFLKPEIVSSSTSKNGRRNSEKSTHSHSQINPAILMGGARGIRRLSSTMLTEIVRVSMQHKKKNPVTESGVLSPLVGNQHALKNVNLIVSAESIPDVASSLAGSASNSSSLISHGLIQRGNSNHDHDFLTSFVMKEICSCELESSVYSDC